MTDNSPSSSPTNLQNQKSDNSGTDAEILDKLQNLPQEDKDQIIATMEMYSGPI